MTKKIQKIAIFGATGHIGKNISYYFSQDEKNNLTLFGRNEKKMQKTMDEIISKNRYSFEKYEKFMKNKYDVIINCIGIGDLRTIKKNDNILEVTEYYDNKILEYIKKKKDTLYINFSSGVVFGKKFKHPVTESTMSLLDINKLDVGDFYTLSKIYSEGKHRNLNNLNIVDLRIFSFFSRFIDLKTDYLMSQITNAIKNNEKFVTDNNDIMRDYIHPQDLIQIIKKCIKKRKINTAFDISSKKPISKFRLLKSISNEYGLNYIIQKKEKKSPTEIKMHYYSKSKKIEKLQITPKYPSIKSILMELDFLIK